jgi:hypothetical protein
MNFSFALVGIDLDLTLPYLFVSEMPFPALVLIGYVAERACVSLLPSACGESSSRTGMSIPAHLQCSSHVLSFAKYLSCLVRKYRLSVLLSGTEIAGWLDVHINRAGGLCLGGRWGVKGMGWDGEEGARREGKGREWN